METEIALKVFIAYESVAAAVRAREMSERLAAELSSECEVWNMDSLAYLPLRELAAKAASQADMVVIAARGDEILPAHVQDWIEDWLSQRSSSPTALVALLDEDEEGLPEPPPLYAYLAQIAERGGMDFFSNAGRRGRHSQNTEKTKPRGAGRELAQATHHDFAWLGWGSRDYREAQQATTDKR